MAAGAAVLVVVNLFFLRRSPTLDVLTMVLGAGFLLLADAAWLAGRPVPFSKRHTLTVGYFATHAATATATRPWPSTSAPSRHCRADPRIFAENSRPRAG